MTGVNLSVPRVAGNQLDKHHVIPQITLSARVITHTHTHTHCEQASLSFGLLTFDWAALVA